MLGGCGQGKPEFKSVDITGADFGKHFELKDHTGKQRKLSDFQGKVVMLFYGFTHCPDVCPTALMDMKNALDRLGSDRQRAQVVPAAATGEFGPANDSARM